MHEKCESSRLISTTCRCREVLDIGDGSQDLLLVRLQAGPYVGWGECEASPLVSIASLVCPDVAQRLQAGARLRPRPDARRRRRHRPHRRSGPRQQPRCAAVEAHPLRHRHRHVGPARSPTRDAGLPAPRLSASRAAPALCLRPLRRHAAGDAGQGAWHPRQRLSRRQVRLGTVRSRQRGGGRGAGRGGSGGTGRGRHSARRCRHRLGA